MRLTMSDLPSTITAKDREVIKNALKEMSDSTYQIEAQKDLQKDIAQKILDEVGIPKKDFNRLAKIFHASNLVEEAAKNEEFMEFAAEILIGPANQIESK
jgi:nitrate reductase beta subunit